MTGKAEINSVGVSLNVGTAAPNSQGTPRPLRSRDPFCILVAGNFSGRTSSSLRSPDSLSARPIVEIDRGNFDQVFTNLQPQLQLSLGDQSRQTVELTFTELDDFHPDQLFDSVKLFAKLRTLRRRLQNRDTFAEAARQMGAIKEQGGNFASAPTPDEGSLLDAALEATQDIAPASTIDQLIREVVAPFVIPAADPRLPELLASVDSGIADLMRQLLHHPEFQELEANWRSVYSLVRKLETNRTLKIQLLDVSLDEIREDFTNAKELTQAALYRQIVSRSDVATGPFRPAVMVGCWKFEPTLADVELVSQLASVTAAADATLIASADSTFVGCPSFDRFPDPDDWQTPASEFLVAWDNLRAQPEARHVALTMPRVLLRRPYNDDVESFEFFELPDSSDHNSYLWGHAAFLYAQILGQAFTTSDWELRYEGPTQIEGLPMHFYNEHGETVAKPCAEGWLTSTGATVIIESGFVPILSVKETDSIRLAALRPIRNAQI